jgi:peptidoglycan/LPS O-acetylase OafA/YrhL
LVWLGRWSLPYYMLHQPVLIGLVSAFAWFKP